MQYVKQFNNFIVVVLLSLISVTSYAQSTTRSEFPSDRSKMDAKVSMLMHYALEQQEKKTSDEVVSPSKLLDVLITDTDTSGELHVKLFVKTTDLGAALGSIDGLEVLGQFGEVASIRVPALQLERLASLESVSRIEAMHRRAPLNDNANEETGVNRLHQIRTTSVPNGYLGQGVIVGVIDTGIDFNHPDFRNESGTRILFIRETNEGETKVWSANDINTNPSSVTQRDFDGHGTHVAGTAASSNPNYLGVAPLSDIVAVKTDFSDGDILAGVQFVFNVATELNRPAVANLSLGGHSGSHDGNSLSDVAMSSLAGPGRVIVAAGGNEGQDFLHSSHQSQGNSPQTGTYTPIHYNSGKTVIGAYFDEPADVKFGIVVFFKGTLTYSRAWGKGDAYEKQELQAGPGFTVTFEGETSKNEGIHEILILAQYSLEDVPNVEEGDFEIYMYSYGSGTFNAWVQNGDHFNPAQNIEARIYGGNTNSTVGSPATAKEVIAVGSYVTRNSWTAANGSQNNIEAQVGNISGFSSKGPSRDGRLLPHITAPGELIASASSSDIPEDKRDVARILPGGMHHLSEGTSMATPHTAGIIALMLEANPNLNAREVRDILQQTARSDNFTSVEIPNNTWGPGKIDAYAAVMAAANRAVNIDRDSTVPGDYALHQNYPNPFNPSTNISFTIPVTGNVQLSVYNVLGQRVSTLLNGPMSAGSHTVNFSASRLSSGVYLYQLRAGDFVQNRTMLLIK